MNFPVLIYDNLCTSCTEYAKYVDKLLRGQITIIGHYTPEGKEFKNMIFPPGYEGTEMSWFVTEDAAYGGRKGLIKLMKYTLVRKKKNFPPNKFDLNSCTTDCRTVKGVMIRSCSILTDGKVIQYN